MEYFCLKAGLRSQMKAGTCRTITDCGHWIRESVTSPAQLHIVLCTWERIPTRLMSSVS